MATRRKATPASRRPARAPGRGDGWGRVRGLALLVWAHLPWLRVPLSLLAMVHLMLVFLLPSGSNALLGLEARGPTGYIRNFQVEDATGFSVGARHDRFFLFRIYTQGGEVVEETFPDFNATPRLRLERWLHGMDRVSGPWPNLHEHMLRYILDELPAAPMRLDLFAARWRTAIQPMDVVRPAALPSSELQLELLGRYDGLTRTWKPQPPREKEEEAPK